MTRIRVAKRDAHGQETLHYHADLVTRGPDYLCVQARFAYADAVPIGHGVSLRRGDHMTEWFYSNRYYNIFRVASGAGGALRCWYCNLTRPAVLSAHAVHADDLALDVLVLPDRRLHLLDTDEFDALGLPAAERARAWQAVRQLRQQVSAGAGPFAR